MALKASDLVPIEEIEFSDFELLVGFLKMRGSENKPLKLIKTIKSDGLKKENYFKNYSDLNPSRKYERKQLNRMSGAA